MKILHCIGYHVIAVDLSSNYDLSNNFLDSKAILSNFDPGIQSLL